MQIQLEANMEQLLEYKEAGNARVGSSFSMAIRYKNAEFKVDNAQTSLFIPAKWPLPPKSMMFTFERADILSFRVYQGILFSIIQIQHCHQNTRSFIAFETLREKILLQALNDFSYSNVQKM